MKVIRVKSGNSFYAVGVNLINKRDGYAYGVVSDKYGYGEKIFNGTKKKCIEFIEKII